MSPSFPGPPAGHRQSPDVDSPDDSVGRRRQARGEIQGLRAVAVLLVVAYHLYPNRLSGGYVGVDVFFVISGFLITAHIAKQINDTGTLSLRDFWARRMRRLLPASFVVLLFSLVMTWAFIPQTMWDQTIRQILASALYVQNWALATDAVDYSAAGNTPTLVQHYWSLSVEEQFYVVWPLLALAAAVTMRFVGRAHHVQLALVVGISVVTAASFWYSVSLTHADPGRAYFVTGTRAWEFGVGSLLALTLQSGFRNSRVRIVSGWLGILAVLYSAVAFDARTEFPGWIAAVPVVGTALVIAAAGSELRGSVARWLSLRTAVSIGDISYAVYLWHWPFIILFPYVVGRPLGHSGAAAVVVLTLIVSWCSTHWIENPLRGAPWLSHSFLRSAGLAALSMSVLVAGGFALRSDLDRQIQASQSDLSEVLDSPQGCTGPAALDPANECDSVAGPGPLVAQPAAVARQNSVEAFPNCQSPVDGKGIKSCELGEVVAPSQTVALVGDSHATHWFSAFDALGKTQDIRVLTFTRSACPFTAAIRLLPDGPPDHAAACIEANAEVLSRLLEDERVSRVFTSTFTSAYKWVDRKNARGREALRGGVKEYVDTLASAGKELIVIRDVPQVKDQVNTPDCLVVARSQRDCGLPRNEALVPDLYAIVAKELGLTVIDLSSQFCDAEWCHAVVGNVIVYRDYSHLSSEYSTLLAPYLAGQTRR